MEINPDMTASKGKNTKFHFTSEVQTFEFTFDEVANNTRVGMLLGGNNIKDSTVTIYQFEIVEVPAEA